MKGWGNEKRKANNAKHKALKLKKFGFNVCSFAKSNTFMQYDSFHGNVFKIAAIEKVKNYPWQSCQHHHTMH